MHVAYADSCGLINVPAGGHPTSVAFLEDGSSFVVATQILPGSSLHMFGEEKATSQTGNSKLPLPERKWEHKKVHDKRVILNLFGVAATFGTADGSTIVASCSEGASYS